MIIKHAIKDKIGKYKGKTVLLKNSWKESFNLFNLQFSVSPAGFFSFLPIKELDKSFKKMMHEKIR